MKKKLQQLLVKNKVDTVIDYLSNLEGLDRDKKTLWIAIESQWNQLKEQRFRKIISYENAQIDHNRIIQNIHQFILTLPESNLPETELTDSSSEIRPSNPKWIRRSIGIVLGLAILAWVGFKVNWTGNTFSQTVIVHGANGIDHRVLKSQGKVVITIGKERFEAIIDQEGIAYFPSVSRNQRNQPARLSLLFAEPYQCLYPDSAYTIRPEQTIGLEIVHSGKDWFTGRVIDSHTEKPLDSVKVSMDETQVWTDQGGYYSLPLPAKQLKPHGKATFSKPHYQTQMVSGVSLHRTTKYTHRMVPTVPF